MGVFPSTKIGQDCQLSETLNLISCAGYSEVVDHSNLRLRTVYCVVSFSGEIKEIRMV